MKEGPEQRLVMLSSSSASLYRLLGAEAHKLSESYSFTRLFSTFKGFEMPPECWKPSTCLGSSAEHIISSPGFQSRVLTASLQTTVGLDFKILRNSSVPLSRSLNRSTRLQVLWKQQVELALFEVQRMRSSVLIQDKLLQQMWGLPYSQQTPNFCTGTSLKEPYSSYLISS